MIPIVATLVANGLSLLGNAVLVKGKEVIEKQLGISLKPNPTPEELVALKEVELRHEEFLLEVQLKENALGVELEKTYAADRASARAREVSVNESANASWLTRNMTSIVTLIVMVAGFYGILGETGEVRTICTNLVIMVLTYYVGTTATSRRKDETISKLSAGGAQ